MKLYFNSKIQDPFNSPKMWIIFLISAWLTGHIIANSQKTFKDTDVKIFTALLGSFVFFGLIAAVTTDITYTAFFALMRLLLFNDYFYVYVYVYCHV